MWEIYNKNIYSAISNIYTRSFVAPYFAMQKLEKTWLAPSPSGMAAEVYVVLTQDRKNLILSI